jgi:hypothetical protein
LSILVQGNLSENDDDFLWCTKQEILWVSSCPSLVLLSRHEMTSCLCLQRVSYIVLTLKLLLSVWVVSDLMFRKLLSCSLLRHWTFRILRLTPFQERWWNFMSFILFLEQEMDLILFCSRSLEGTLEDDESFLF